MFQNTSFKIRKKDFVFGKTSDFLLFRGLGTIKLHACVKADEIDIIYEKQEEPQSFVLLCFDVDCTTFPHLSYQRYILRSSHFVQKFKGCGAKVARRVISRSVLALKSRNRGHQSISQFI